MRESIRPRFEERQMLADMVRELYDHNRWANERVFEAAAHLSTEQFLAGDDTPHGSLRDTMLHMIGAQWFWLNRWDGTAQTRPEALRLAREALDPDRHPDVESVRESWRVLQARTEAFLSDLTDDGATEIMSSTRPGGKEWSVPLWKLLVQIAIHSAQHRSEIALKLTGFGHSPGDLDYLIYLWEKDEATVS
jgi:uncharacterized damage-inducible protein DinB